MYLICHLTSHDHVIDDHLIEGSCKFTGGSSLRYVTTLITLVTVRIVKLTVRRIMAAASVQPR